MKKGQLMRLVYTDKELRNIDAGLPKELWDGKNPEIQVDPYYHVMNYNSNAKPGNLEDMREIALERDIEIDPRKVGVTLKQRLEHEEALKKDIFNAFQELNEYWDLWKDNGTGLDQGYPFETCFNELTLAVKSWSDTDPKKLQ